MTAKQFAAALDRLFGTKTTKGQVEFARLIERNDRTVRDWTGGRRDVPVEIALLINAMLDHKLTKEDLRA
jgi:DNA-binding transcriptional regulator YdaS (Cro superfamily)